jgi:hypothetical protein
MQFVTDVTGKKQEFKRGEGMTQKEQSKRKNGTKN